MRVFALLDLILLMILRRPLCWCVNVWHRHRCVWVFKYKCLIEHGVVPQNEKEKKEVNRRADKGGPTRVLGRPRQPDAGKMKWGSVCLLSYLPRISLTFRVWYLWWLISVSVELSVSIELLSCLSRCRSDDARWPLLPKWSTELSQTYYNVSSGLTNMYQRRKVYVLTGGVSVRCWVFYELRSFMGCWKGWDAFSREPRYANVKNRYVHFLYSLNT